MKICFQCELSIWMKIEANNKSTCSKHRFHLYSSKLSWNVAQRHFSRVLRKQKNHILANSALEIWRNSVKKLRYILATPLYWLTYSTEFYSNIVCIFTRTKTFNEKVWDSNQGHRAPEVGVFSLIKRHMLDQGDERHTQTHWTQTEAHTIGPGMIFWYLLIFHKMERKITTEYEIYDARTERPKFAHLHWILILLIIF